MPSPHGLSIQVEDESLLALVSEFVNKTANPEPALAEIGASVMEDVRQGFISGRAPDGTPWAPLTSRSGRPLRNTGALLNSITYLVSGDEVQIGTGLTGHFPHVHQFGATIFPRHAKFLVFQMFGKTVRARKVTIPARPFLGFPAEWRSNALRALIDLYNRIPKGGA